ncbi:hypothetical protein DFH09DRAFT_1371549 [Mycena vulgaris]|nr:hypothetical protein DFH09DRAFT_1371549 [Mycena vulgaris]
MPPGESALPPEGLARVHQCIRLSEAYPEQTMHFMRSILALTVLVVSAVQAAPGVSTSLTQRNCEIFSLLDRKKSLIAL